MFPRLSDAKLAWLGKRGRRRTLEPGEVLYEHADRDAPFFVIERGLVEFIDRKPGKDVYVAQADGRTFIGDIAVFTGEPTITACVAVEPTDVIEFDRAKLRDDARTLAGVRRAHLRDAAPTARMARGQRSGRHADHRSTRVAAGFRRSRPAGAQPAAGALPRRRHRRGECRDAEVARHPAVRDAGPGPRDRGDAQPLRGTGRAVAPAPRRGRRRALRHGRARRRTRRPRLRGIRGVGGAETFVAEAWAPGGQAGTSTRIENYLGFRPGSRARS